MSARSDAFTARLARAAAARPSLVAAIALGLAVLAALSFAPNLRWSTRSILAWDAGALTFILRMLLHMANRTQAEMRAMSARQDEGRHVILALVLVASAASLAAVAVELGLAKELQGMDRFIRVTFAMATVAASWFMVQLIMALHYAHEFYSEARPGGLVFPGEDEPDYWDFMHFSIVIGVAAQTADIQIASQDLRRLATLHSLIAFVFNTVIVALSINLAAGLF